MVRERWKRKKEKEKDEISLKKNSTFIVFKEDQKRFWEKIRIPAIFWLPKTLTPDRRRRRRRRRPWGWNDGEEEEEEEESYGEAMVLLMQKKMGDWCSTRRPSTSSVMSATRSTPPPAAWSSMPSRSTRRPSPSQPSFFLFLCLTLHMLVLMFFLGDR